MSKESYSDVEWQIQQAIQQAEASARRAEWQANQAANELMRRTRQQSRAPNLTRPEFVKVGALGLLGLTFGGGLLAWLKEMSMGGIVEEVPFETITWNKAPDARTFRKEEWPNVRRWAQPLNTAMNEPGPDGVSLADLLKREWHGLEVPLALVWLESVGDPLAQNKYSHATGLMQVMPRDGNGANYTTTRADGTVVPLFSDRPTRLELMVPSTNIAWGTSILRTYIKVYGSVRDGLNNYYGGGGNNGYGDEVLWLSRYLID